MLVTDFLAKYLQSTNSSKEPRSFYFIKIIYTRTLYLCDYEYAQ